jgi:hypothetical protein
LLARIKKAGWLDSHDDQYAISQHSTANSVVGRVENRLVVEQTLSRVARH